MGEKGDVCSTVNNKDFKKKLRHELDLKRQGFRGQRGGRREQMENLRRTWCCVMRLCLCAYVCMRMLCVQGGVTEQIGTNLTSGLSQKGPSFHYIQRCSKGGSRERERGVGNVKFLREERKGKEGRDRETLRGRKGGELWVGDTAPSPFSSFLSGFSLVGISSSESSSLQRDEK